MLTLNITLQVLIGVDIYNTAIKYRKTAASFTKYLREVKRSLPILVSAPNCCSTLLVGPNIHVYYIYVIV